MRSLALISASVVLLSGCLTTQENPNYEFSTRYKGDQAAAQQYAGAIPAQTTAATYETVPTEVVTYQPAQTQPVYAQQPVVSASTQMAGSVAPTDSAYGARAVSGTPGYMAMQSDRQAATVPYDQADIAPALPAAQLVETAPMRAAGTPIDYDYSGNLITADAATTGTWPADVVRTRPSVGQGYTVQPGDTVYSLSRKTCVGVNVIQSMNGLDTNYNIKIGQTLNLPASVC